MRFRAPLIGFLPLAVFALACPHAAAAAPQDSSYTGTGLRASTAPPWNPASPASSATPWETALRLPGRIASLPLVVLGQLTEASLVKIEDANVVYKVQAVLAVQRKLGFAIGPASLGDRTGLGGEVRWAPPGFGRRLLAEVSGSTAQYNRERLAFLAGPVRAVYTSEWRSRDQFFGVGLRTPHEDESTYGQRLQSAKLIASYPYQTLVPGALRVVEGVVVPPSQVPEQSPPRASVSAWAGPRESFVTYGRDPTLPSFEEVHPADAAGSLHRRTEHFTYGARLAYDARAGRPRWFRGWRAAVEGERFDRSIEALALKDAHTDARSFTRLTYEAEGGVSFGRDPRTFRLELRAVDQRLDDAGGSYLISDLMTLGASQGLAGFEAGRFRDFDLVVGKLTYLWPLGKNLEFDVHAETGGVYPDLQSARLDSFRNSFGAALRVRTDFGILGMIGIETSTEDTRIRFALGGLD